MITALLGGLAGFAFIVLLALPRYIGARRLAAVRTARFYTVPAGTRWLACHTTTCAHTQTVHVPAGDGLWRCTTERCGHLTKGDNK
ncbi:hypothetical protein QOM21_24020 [Streptomyces sp. Pv4-95]|uniref:hypothetical protein n=1 Tax=Streptomyces sp. Pv4-95 TaxID=3049543 RepID=UPI00389284DC